MNGFTKNSGGTLGVASSIVNSLLRLLFRSSAWARWQRARGCSRAITYHAPCFPARAATTTTTGEPPIVRFPLLRRIPFLLWHVSPSSVSAFIGAYRRLKSGPLSCSARACASAVRGIQRQAGAQQVAHPTLHGLDRQSWVCDVQIMGRGLTPGAFRQLQVRQRSCPLGYAQGRRFLAMLVRNMRRPCPRSCSVACHREGAKRLWRSLESKSLVRLPNSRVQYLSKIATSGRRPPRDDSLGAFLPHLSPRVRGTGAPNELPSVRQFISMHQARGRRRA